MVLIIKEKLLCHFRFGRPKGNEKSLNIFFLVEHKIFRSKFLINGLSMLVNNMLRLWLEVSGQTLNWKLDFVAGTSFSLTKYSIKTILSLAFIWQLSVFTSVEVFSKQQLQKISYIACVILVEYKRTFKKKTINIVEGQSSAYY